MGGSPAGRPAGGTELGALAEQGGDLAHGGLLARGRQFLVLEAATPLVAEQLPDLVALADERLRAAPVLDLIGTGKVDVDDLLDPPRSRRHHRDPLTEVDGLVDAVGDEQDGRAGPAPDV